MAPIIPALNQLRCFEAAARHESFTAAADELCLTPSAVSHQIRTLEDSLDVTLFIRLGRKMFLSEQGRTFMQDIQPAFAMIEAGTRRLRSSTSREVLTVAVAPSFAEAWLMPNLSKFIGTHPEIEIRLLTNNQDDDVQNIDCEIRYGHGKWVGMTVEKISDDSIVPLIAADRIADSAKSVDLLNAHPLIHTESRHFTWDHWLRLHNYKTPPTQARLRVDRSPLAIKAAVNGLGIALESTILASREIEDGLLVSLHNLCRKQHEAEETYFLVHSATRRNSSAVSAFTHWLRSAFDKSSRKNAPSSRKKMGSDSTQQDQGFSLGREAR